MKLINKLIIPIFVLIILSVSVYAEVIPDTSIINQLNERLERNRVEILKAVRDAQNQSQNSTSASIDQNFEVLDKRILDFFNGAKRDIAIIMLAGFLVGFALSQIIRLTIEKARRRSLIRKGQELEVAVENLNKEAVQLTAKVRQLKSLDEQYSKELKGMTKREPLITLKMVLFGIITLLLGLAVAIIFKVKF